MKLSNINIKKRLEKKQKIYFFSKQVMSKSVWFLFKSVDKMKRTHQKRKANCRTWKNRSQKIYLNIFFTMAFKGVWNNATPFNYCLFVPVTTRLKSLLKFDFSLTKKSEKILKKDSTQIQFKFKTMLYSNALYIAQLYITQQSYYLKRRAGQFPYCTFHS